MNGLYIQQTQDEAVVRKIHFEGNVDTTFSKIICIFNMENRNAKNWVARLPQKLTFISSSWQDGLFPDPEQATKPLFPFKFGAESRGAIIFSHTFK